MSYNFSHIYRFSDWPNKDIPLVAAGVYAIWEKDLLIYCGMSGRSIESNRNKKKYGLITRLDSHQKGRLSGDQFCVYVANRLVIPSLTSEQLPKFGTGELKLDALVKKYINEKFSYQFCVLDSSSEAYHLEGLTRGGSIFDCKPLLNPAG